MTRDERTKALENAERVGRAQQRRRVRVQLEGLIALILEQEWDILAAAIEDVRPEVRGLALARSRGLKWSRVRLGEALATFDGEA